MLTLSAFPISVERDDWDWIFDVIAALGAIAAAAAVVVAVWTTVLSRRDTKAADDRALAADERARRESASADARAQAAEARADAADARLEKSLREQAFERRASAALRIQILSTWEDVIPTANEQQRVARVVIENASEFAITDLEIGGWDSWTLVPRDPVGAQVNPVREILGAGRSYRGYWIVDGSGRFPAHPPVVASFTDRYLQRWQLANGQHLRLISAHKVIENDWMPHVAADSIDALGHPR